jgi:hypothetical protein
VTLSVQWKGLEKLQRDLAKAKSTAVPYAMKSALTTQAFEARRIWQGEIRAEFTLRNQYTERSIIAVKASGTGASMQSSVGSFAEYMGDQEEGANVRGRSGHKGIPGAAAAGQAPGSKRTRVVRAANRLGALTLLHPTTRGSKKQRNAMAIAMAVRQGKKAVLLERTRGGKGIFSITGGQRTWGKRKFRQRQLKLRMLWDFSRSSVHVPGSHTLARTLRALEPKVVPICERAILDQLRRHHVLGY